VADLALQLIDVILEFVYFLKPFGDVLAIFRLFLEADRIRSAAFLFLERHLGVVLHHYFTLVVDLGMTLGRQVRLRNLPPLHLLTLFFLIWL
jgi:hypothetical protein